jgi:hypothetical protein
MEPETIVETILSEDVQQVVEEVIKNKKIHYCILLLIITIIKYLTVYFN